MMRTKDYRRHKQFYKFKRRVDLFSTWRWGGCNKFDFWEDIKKGRYSWLRTTGRPCNCYSCTIDKYKRPSKSEIKKLIIDSLEVSDAEITSM